MYTLSPIPLMGGHIYIYIYIGVRGYPYGIFDPWVRWRSGSGVAGKFFSAHRRRRKRHRRRLRPLPGVECLEKYVF